MLTLQATQDLDALSLDLRGLTVDSVAGRRPRAAVRADRRRARRPRAPQAQGGHHAHRDRRLRRHGRQPAGRRGGPVRLLHLPRRRLHGQRARRRLHLVPGQRRADGQGDVRHRASPSPRARPASRTASWCRSTTTDGLTRWEWASDDPMASYLSTASVGNYTFTQQEGPGGLPILNFVDQDLSAGPGRDHRGEPRAAAGDDRLLRGPVRAVPLRLLRRDRRRRLGRLRAGDADPPDLLRRGPRGHRGARARPPVGRQQRLPRGLARHLAERGLRHVRRVAVDRAPRRRDRAGELRGRRRDPGRRRVLDHRRRRPRPARACSSARSTTAARRRCTRCAWRSATRRSSRSCAAGPPRTPTAT